MIRHSRRALLLALFALASCDSPQSPVAPEAPSSMAGALLESAPLHVVQLNNPLATTRICQWVERGGGTLEAGPVRIDFPGGALAQTTQICVTVGGEDLEATFEPHGLLFPSDSRPRLRLDYRDAREYVESSLKVVYSDPVTNAILEINATEIRISEKRVEALLDHFSTWAMASN